MKEANPKVFEYCSRTENIFHFQYGFEQVKLEYNGDIVFDEDVLTVLDRAGNKLGSISRYHNDGSVFYNEREIKSNEDATDFEEPVEGIDLISGKKTLVASRFNISLGLKNLLFDACLTLINEAKEVAPRDLRIQIHSSLIKLVDRYILTILTTPTQLLIIDYPSSWGLSNDDKTENVLWSTTKAELPGDIAVSKVSLAKRVVHEICTDLKHWLLTRIEDFSNPSIYESASGLNNGLFYHNGGDQITALGKFFSSNKYQNIDPEDKEIWVKLLSGLELPDRNITWYGPKTHLFYLLLCAAEAKRVFPDTSVVICPVHQQVQWNELGKYILLSNGERLSRKHGTNGITKYRSRKTSPYEYIEVLFR